MSRALRTVAVSFRVSGTNLSENPQPAKMRRCTGNRTNFICLEPKVPGENQKEKILRWKKEESKIRARGRSTSMA